MYLTLTIFLFLLGFFCLIRGGDLLVDGASSLAKRLNVPQILIGLTVVAFGTSLPELFVNVIASVESNADIAIGNIFGSNIANILLILGTIALFYPFTVNKNTAFKEIPLSLVSALVTLILVRDGMLSPTDGVVLLLFFVVFLYYIVSLTKLKGHTEEVPKLSTTKTIASIIFGIALLPLGGKLVVDNATIIATSLNINQGIIAFLLIGLGTSLPEFFASVMAARKKEVDLSVGNIMGSVLFNTFFILGSSAIITPIPFNTPAITDSAVYLITTLALLIVTIIGHKRVINGPAGITFLLMYFGYIGYKILG